MTTQMIFGVLATVLGSVFRGSLVGFLCHDAALMGDVMEYCSVLVLGIPLLCYIMSLSYFARSDGSPKLSFQAVLISNAINLTMDIVLMKFCGLGLRGAALDEKLPSVLSGLNAARHIRGCAPEDLAELLLE